MYMIIQIVNIILWSIIPGLLHLLIQCWKSYNWISQVFSYLVSYMFNGHEDWQTWQSQMLSDILQNMLRSTSIILLEKHHLPVARMIAELVEEYPECTWCLTFSPWTSKAGKSCNLWHPHHDAKRLGLCIIIGKYIVEVITLQIHGNNHHLHESNTYHFINTYFVHFY